MKHLIKYTIILLASLTSIYGFAQTTAPPVIELPGGGGSMIGDIVHANGKIFCYGADGISILNASNYSILDTIPFNDTIYELGKFNPLYFTPSDISLMVLNTNNEYLYILTPKLKFLVINTADISQTWTTSLLTEPVEEGEDPVYLDQIMDTQSESVIMKYDEAHDRLYVIVASRDPDSNPFGNFHEIRSLFGIYEINNGVDPDIQGHFEVLYSEVREADVSELGDHIINFAFNDTNDYYYVVRLGRREVHEPEYISKSIIEVREIGITDARRTIDFENENGSGYYKMGKVLYIHDIDHDVHKIVFLPYSYFRGEVPMPRFYVIDGDNSLNANYDQMVYSPSRKVLDAIYLEENQDLVISYAPDNNEIYNANPNTNIAIFHYDTDEAEFEDEDGPTFQSTNDNSPNTSFADLNASLYLTKTSSTSTLISKKDGIAKLQYGNNTYTYSVPVYEAEGNSFWRGVITNDTAFVLNGVANGMEVIDIQGYQHVTSIRTGYPVYDVTANTDGSNLYFYNTLNAHDIGLYAYDPSEGTSTHLDIATAIGDVVYNPWQDHFLVSKFEPGNAEIIKFDASTNVPLTETIHLTATEFVKEMFISPEGKLYVCTNMETGQNPSVYIFDATTEDYTPISSIPTTGFLAYEDALGNPLPSVYYQAHFAFSPYDTSVFVSIKIHDLKLLPYNSQESRIYNWGGDDENPLPPPPGKLLVIKDNALENEIDLAHFPGKILCPDNENDDVESQYYGKVFIQGEHFYVYDCLAETPPQQESDLEITTDYFLNMVYTSFHDKIFAVKEDVGSNGEHRTYKIYSINYNNDELDIDMFNLGMTQDGQIASMFYNKYDRKVYVYQKIDAEKLGNTQLRLLSFDPGLTDPTWNIVDLGMAGYFPDYDHTVDKANYYYYNMTEPYISPTTNQIYVPNGGHSCVSKVPFTAREPLLLYEDKEKWAWLSFPRIDRTMGEYIPVNFVIGGDNIAPGDYGIGSELLNLPLTQDEYVSNYYNGSSWETGQNIDLPYIYSEFGYKLKLDYGPSPPEKKWVLLSGTVLDPNTTVSVYPEHENWEGYWLYQSQSPFDAIPENVLNQLDVIKAQDWYCYKYWDTFKDSQLPGWICGIHLGGSDVSISLDYGDMVILESFTSNQINFEWLSYGNPPEHKEKPVTEYYEFEEKADYTAFFIELDSTENPQEIGAFIGDSCVGATSVLAEDTLVLVAGYIEGMSGEVAFEEYYGSEKTRKPPIRSYYVNNNKTNIWERRTIHTTERQGHYLISFKQDDTENELNIEKSFIIYPNPVSNMLNINYSIVETAMVSINVFDSYGRLMATLLNRNQATGSHSMQWNLKGNSGTPLPKGLYILKLEVDNSISSRKVVID